MKILSILSPIKLSWGDVRSHKKFGPDQFSRLLDTNKETNRQKDTQAMYKDVKKNKIPDVENTDLN